MSTTAISPQMFAILNGLVAERTGLHFDVSHQSLFVDKVWARACEAGFASLLDYYYCLRYDDPNEDEFKQLVEALVVGETYLFRELPPVEVAIRRIIAPRVQPGYRPRIWSAACATGEEPHSIAMVLSAAGLQNAVDLVASDINATSLKKARTGMFGRRAVRETMPDFAGPWVEVQERAVTVLPAITDLITWRQINLLDEARIEALGTFDVIFCRNVLIYFSDEVIRKVVRRLHGSLRPGGALLVGVSESLLRLGVPLRCEELEGVFVYRRAE